MTALDDLTIDGLLRHAQAPEQVRNLKPPADPRMMRLALGFTSQHRPKNGSEMWRRHIEEIPIRSQQLKSL